MHSKDMFFSAVQDYGDLAGVFEYDGITGFFYLYKTKGAMNNKVVAAIHVATGNLDFKQEDIDIKWDASDKYVGLFIRRKLWAVFNGETCEMHGGTYRPNSQPLIPVDIALAFNNNL